MHHAVQTAQADLAAGQVAQDDYQEVFLCHSQQYFVEVPEISVAVVLKDLSLQSQVWVVLVAIHPWDLAVGVPKNLHDQKEMFQDVLLE